MNKDAQGRWKVGMSNIKLKMRVYTYRVFVTNLADAEIAVAGVVLQSARLGKRRSPYQRSQQRSPELVLPILRCGRGFDYERARHFPELVYATAYNLNCWPAAVPTRSRRSTPEKLRHTTLATAASSRFLFVGLPRSGEHAGRTGMQATADQYSTESGTVSSG